MLPPGRRDLRGVRKGHARHSGLAREQRRTAFGFPYTLMHAAKCIGVISRSAGTLSWHSFVAMGQRV